MSLEFVFFIILAAVAAVSALMMVTRPHPVFSAIFLVLNFFALAGLYMLLNAQFISVVQVIVYAGAIMVLFLFVIMLINSKSEIKLLLGSNKIKYIAIFMAAVVFFQLAYLIFASSPSKHIVMNKVSSVASGRVETIGKEMYMMYVLPLEASGFLLLAATIGALVLAKKKFE
jgi:NADH-quinone oxidoreductase subunit J